MIRSLSKREKSDKGYILHNGDMTDDEVLDAVKKRRDKRTDKNIKS